MSVKVNWRHSEIRHQAAALLAAAHYDPQAAEAYDLLLAALPTGIGCYGTVGVDDVERAARSLYAARSLAVGEVAAERFGLALTGLCVALGWGG